MWASIKLAWATLSPRLKWIVVVSAMGVLAVVVLLLKLHNADAQAQQLLLKVQELQSRQKVAVLDADIAAAQATAGTDQRAINILVMRIADERATLCKTYIDAGLTPADVVERFKSLGWT